MKKRPSCRHGVPLDEYCIDCGEAAYKAGTPYQETGIFDTTFTPLPLFAPGSDTSRAAAENVQPRVAGLLRKVYDAIKASGKLGLTTDEVMAVLGKGPDEKNTIAPRVTTLKQSGLIVDSKRRRPSNRGNPMAVFVVKRGGEHDDKVG